MDAIIPCLWFDDQAEQAAEFYSRTFPGGRVTATASYPATGDNPPGRPPGNVLTVDFEIGGQRFVALNGGPVFVPNPSISFFVELRSAEEVDRVYGALAKGGKELMAIGPYPWSKRYGWVEDRYGFSWQVLATDAPPRRSIIVPCLMFSDAQHGKAELAMQTYVRDFPDSHVVSVERYSSGEGPEGAVKHGRFVLAGQDFIAMDSHVLHGISFNEAVSLQVMCEDQAEVDRYWDTLSEGGQQVECGWVKDRFGLSWQIVPVAMQRWLNSADSQERDRVFRAMLQMKKLDIAALQAASHPASG